MAELSKADFLSKWALKFADNTIQNFTEALFREFRQDVADSFAPGGSPNHQPGLLKAFRFATSAEVAANGGYGEALDTLVYASCCVHTRIYVETYQPDPAVAARRNVVLGAVFDLSAPAAHLVYVDGSFRPGDLVPVRFVPLDDPAAQYGYVRPYDPTTSFRLGELTIYTEGGQTYFARAQRAGKLSQPVSATDTTDWKREPTPTPTLGLTGRVYQTEAQWRYLLDNSRVAPGQPYTLEFAGGLLLIDGGADSDGFAGSGELQLPGQGGAVTKQFVLADVAAGTYTPLSSSFAALLGQPGDNAALSAALQQLADGTSTQQQRIDAVLQALVPLQADPVTKNYVDNLVLAISHIDADQATAIQQLQQHLASDEGLLQGILSTQATHTQQLSDLQARTLAKYYGSTGQNTDGSMTQKSASETFALKGDISQLWPDMNNFAQPWPQNANRIAVGVKNYFHGDVTRDLPLGKDPYTKAGGLMYWVAYADTTVTFSQGTLDGQASVHLANGEWRIVNGEGGFAGNVQANWTTLLRGTLNDPAPGTGASPSIDYANPTTLTQATTLTANTAYYVKGAGYALTLPDASQNLGKVIFLKVASSATGLYPLAGADKTLYTGESISLRSTPDGWDPTGGRLLAMEARLETSLAQQDALYDGMFIPFSVVQRSNVAGLADTGRQGFVVQRTNRAGLLFTSVLKNVVGNYIYFQVQAVAPDGTVRAVGGNFVTVAVTGSTYIGNVTVPVAPQTYVAATFLRVQVFLGPGSSANLHGAYDGNQSAFTLSEDNP